MAGGRPNNIADRKKFHKTITEKQPHRLLSFYYITIEKQELNIFEFIKEKKQHEN